jgi:hypothetical protein
LLFLILYSHPLCTSQHIGAWRWNALESLGRFIINHHQYIIFIQHEFLLVHRKIRWNGLMLQWRWRKEAIWCPSGWFFSRAPILNRLGAYVLLLILLAWFGDILWCSLRDKFDLFRSGKTQWGQVPHVERLVSYRRYVHPR